MNTQPDLGFPSKRTIKPSPERATPVVWVRELRLLRDLKPDGEVIRSLTLHPGLNILWAKPADKNKTTTLYEDGMSGHATGKTTFCRLVRYVLGEDNYGNSTLREGVRRKFNNGGWVVAEVYLEGNPWLVGRPLGLGPHPFAIQGKTIEALFDDSIRLSYDEFRKAIEQAIVAALPVKRFASNGEVITWSHLLPWLTRDQECRYSDLDDWRNKLSESVSPRTLAGDCQYLMRAVLSLVSEQEQLELERNAQLLIKNRQNEALLPKLQHQSAIDVDRLKIALETELPELGNELFYQSVTAELQKRGKILDAAFNALPTTEEINSAQEIWRLDESKVEAARERRDEVISTIETHRKAVQVLRNEITEESYKQHLASRPPAKGFCSVPLELARESRCKLAFERHPELVSPPPANNSEEKIREHLQIIEELSKEVPRKETIVLGAQEAAKASRKRLSDLQSKQLAGMQEIAKERQKLSSIESLATNAKNAWSDTKKLGKEIAFTNSEIEDSRKRQEQIRKQHKKAMSLFSDAFEQVIRAVLGKSLSAGADFAGRAIDLKVEYNGPLTSAAIETVKIIAFDIAAMLTSVEGRGFHPRFLIHDGPREADMSAEIYQKFFLFLREMEAAFPAKSAASFQYIITTTEPPPEELCANPWLIETLDASDPSKRLFRQNL